MKSIKAKRFYTIKITKFENWANFEDFEKELEDFNNLNKGIIEAKIIERNCEWDYYNKYGEDK